MKVTEIVQGILARIPDKENIPEDYMDTLFQVIEGFLKGKVSVEVLNFYFEKQYKIEHLERDKIIAELKQIRGHIDGGDHLSARFPVEFNYPKVSVIITTYNRKHFLKQAIDSFLHQDYPNIEIIVIDDCSNDGTDRMMEEIYKTHRQVIYMKNEKNEGPGNNRRKAFHAYADGEYTLFFDDDDYLIDMNYISKAVKFHIQHPDVSFVAANVLLEYTITKRLKVSFLDLNEIINRKEYFINFEKPSYPKPASTLTTLFKREALIKMNITKMKMVNDSSIYLRSLLVGDAGFINVVAGVYRIHGDNITFRCTCDFIVENLNEKKLIKEMAIQQFDYSPNEMDEWFIHTAYNTISYFLTNSAKKPHDFKYMYNWVRKNCPRIYHTVRSESRRMLLKRKLIRFGVFNYVQFLRKSFKQV